MIASPTHTGSPPGEPTPSWRLTRTRSLLATASTAEVPAPRSPANSRRICRTRPLRDELHGGQGEVATLAGGEEAPHEGEPKDEEPDVLRTSRHEEAAQAPADRVHQGEGGGAGERAQRAAPPRGVSGSRGWGQRAPPSFGTRRASAAPRRRPRRARWCRGCGGTCPPRPRHWLAGARVHRHHVEAALLHLLDVAVAALRISSRTAPGLLRGRRSAGLRSAGSFSHVALFTTVAPRRSCHGRSVMFRAWV